MFESVSQSKISTFHCRKNRVGGNKIDHVLMCKSRHLEILDLTKNKLSEHNGKLLLKYTKTNATIEFLLLGQNHLVSAQVIKEIDEECRQNILIKRNILPSLPLKHPQPNETRKLGQQYDLRELHLQEKSLEYVDFLKKFAQGNSECTTLKLSKIDLQSAHEQQIKSVFD